MIKTLRQHILGRKRVIGLLRLTSFSCPHPSPLIFGPNLKHRSLFFNSFCWPDSGDSPASLRSLAACLRPSRMWRLARATAAGRTQVRLFTSPSIPGPCIVHKRGTDILHDPWFNKVVELFPIFLGISMIFLSGVLKVTGE